jgi:hypothetical protein
MPRIDPERIKQAQIVLQKKKVFTFDELLSALNCSTRSVRSLLKQWQSFTSYNQNGRYYTLPDIPHFDKNGLWRFGEIHFSKHGNLKKTVIELVNQSHCGLSGQQLGDLLGLSPGSFLHHFRDTPGMRREKQGGVYVYFSADEHKYKDQSQRRVSSLEMAFITEADAIAILVALIKTHAITAEQIMALPQVKARRLSSAAIENFLQHHGLLKKTLDTRR